MDSELEFLQQLSRVTLVDLTGGEESFAFLPRWETEEVDFAAAYAERLAEVGQKATACLPATTCSPLRMAA